MSHPINTINSENYLVTLWEKEKKNQILKMADTTKKQKVWNSFFPKTKLDDNYLLGNIF